MLAAIFAFAAIPTLFPGGSIMPEMSGKSGEIYLPAAG
jgi:hypothetical protein